MLEDLPFASLMLPVYSRVYYNKIPYTPHSIYLRGTTTLESCQKKENSISRAVENQTISDNFCWGWSWMQGSVGVPSLRSQSSSQLSLYLTGHARHTALSTRLILSRPHVRYGVSQISATETLAASSLHVGAATPAGAWVILNLKPYFEGPWIQVASCSPQINPT